MSLTPYLPNLDVYANILLNPVLNHQIKNGRTETLKLHIEFVIFLTLYVKTKKYNKCMRVDFTEVGFIYILDNSNSSSITF